MSSFACHAILFDLGFGEGSERLFLTFVILSVTWACGPPIEMKINHGGAEITEKTP
jgi:hypothetical protein